MKKFYYAMMALMSLAVFSCSEPEPEPIVEPEDQNAWDVLYKVNVDYYFDLGYTGVTLNYADFVNEGKHIWDEFGLTEYEFIKALGSQDVSSSSTAQADNDINFGAIDGSTGYLNETTSTTNGWGHWFTAQGDVCSWGDDAYFFTEGYFVSNENLEISLGNYPGHISGGEKCSIMEVFYDDDITVAVQFNINVTSEAPKVEVSIVGTQDLKVSAAYDGEWAATSIDELIDFAAIASAIGCDANDATVYGMNADGSLFGIAGTNFWYSVAGDVMNYGDGCGIDINKDAGYWAFCNYPDETIAGKTCFGAIVFANPATGKGYAVKLAVSLSTIDYLAFNVRVSYENGESIYTLNENNLAALAKALGVDSVAASLIGTTYPLKGIQADGSVYEGGFTANNGFWYSSKSNVTNWGSDDFCAYIEYRGDYNFGCGLWQESGYAQTVKLGVGDAILTFNMVVDEPTVFDVKIVQELAGEATMNYADGYAGGTIALDKAALMQVLDLTEDSFSSNYILLAYDQDGAVTSSSTGENGGYWFNADGKVCGWGDDGSTFYMNPATAEGYGFDYGIRAEEGHCTDAGTWKTTVLIANKANMTAVAYTFTLNVTK